MSYFKSKIPYIGSNFSAPRAIPTHQTIVAINPEKKQKQNKTKTTTTVKAFEVNMSDKTCTEEWLLKSPY